MDNIFFRKIFSRPRGTRGTLETLESLATSYRLSTPEDSPCPKVTHLLIQKAKAWKVSQKYLVNPELSPTEEARLKQADRYPRFFKALFDSKDLLRGFFEWVLRDNNRFDVFVHFPAIASRMVEVGLSGRLGVIGKEAIRISIEYPRKLFILVEGRYEPLDTLERVVEFQNGYKLKWEEVFQVFENKIYEGGNLEVMQRGIQRWSTQLEKLESIEDLPVFKTLNFFEMKRRYDLEITEEDWVVAAVATRERRNLDFNGTHACLELAIPIGEGYWNIYDFGKVAKRYPHNIFELLEMLCRLSYATISYPDDNVFYTFRQEGKRAFPITADQGRRFLDKIRDDLKEARQNNLVYQVETENCAKWVFETLQKVLGQYTLDNFFRIPLLETEASGFMGAVFRFISRLPKPWQRPAFYIGHFLAGGFQTTRIVESGVEVVKSILKHEFTIHGYVFLPAFLVHRQEAYLIRSIFDRSRRMAAGDLSKTSFGSVKFWLKNGSFSRFSLWLIYGTLSMIFAKLRRRVTLSTLMRAMTLSLWVLFGSVRFIF